MKSRHLTGAVLLLLILILIYYVTVTELYSMKVPSNHYCSNQLTNCPPDATKIAAARENKSTMNRDPTNSPGRSDGSEPTDRFHLSLAYLSLKEREQFDNCVYSGKTITHNASLDNGTCHFMNGTGRRPVALASFPGSGNTWVRGLLEKATGICTGAIYCDRLLRVHGFPGEGIRGSSVLVVKTHNCARKRDPTRQYRSAILIARNPKDALIADWHRRCAKSQNMTGENRHVLSVGKEYFGANERWDHFVKTWGPYWQRLMKCWAEVSANLPLHVVYFEDLKTRTVEEVLKMLNFLEFSSAHKKILLESLSDTQYYRKQRDNFRHFTPDQEMFINRMIVSTNTALVQSGFSLVDRYLALGEQLE